jgi:hypothetical protein
MMNSQELETAVRLKLRLDRLGIAALQPGQAARRGDGTFLDAGFGFHTLVASRDRTSA